MKKHSFYRVKVAVLPCKSYAFMLWKLCFYSVKYTKTRKKSLFWNFRKKPFSVFRVLSTLCAGVPPLWHLCPPTALSAL